MNEGKELIKLQTKLRKLGDGKEPVIVIRLCKHKWSAEVQVEVNGGLIRTFHSRTFKGLLKEIYAGIKEEEERWVNQSRSG